MKISKIALYSSFICMLTIITSCGDTVTEFDCGIVETEITDISNSVGSYDNFAFTNVVSSNFEQAAVSIIVTESNFLNETGDCFSFTPIAQGVESISITSNGDIVSEGVVFTTGEELSELFIVRSLEETYTISEFINPQNAAAIRFDFENDEIVFQLMNEPDDEINQSFLIQFALDDSTVLNTEVNNFMVSN